VDGRFVMVPHGMWSDPRLRKTPLAVSVYCEVFQYERKGRAPYIGRTTLSTRLGCSIDTVDRAVRAMVSAGWVVIERRTGKTHLWHRGDGRTDAAIGGRTDAAGIAAPMRPEVEEGVEEESSRSMKIRSESSRQPPASRRLRRAWFQNDLGFDLRTALLTTLEATA
jgi:hypothetical protein